jgi:hypothetical protein
LPRHGLPVQTLGHLRRDSNSQFQTLLKLGARVWSFVVFEVLKTPKQDTSWSNTGP